MTLTALATILAAGPKSPFLEGATTDQKLARINQAYERFYSEAAWKGNRTVLDNLTTTSGILTLAAAYSSLVAISVPETGNILSIKAPEWEFQQGGPASQDWDTYGVLVAIDRGDVAGSRTYRITGDPDTVDALTFRALVKKRFVRYTANDTVTPDNTEAVRMGCLALHYEDEGDYERGAQKIADAIGLLNSDLVEFQPDEPPRVQFDGMLANISNIV